MMGKRGKKSGAKGKRIIFAPPQGTISPFPRVIAPPKQQSEGYYAVGKAISTHSLGSHTSAKEK